MAEHVHKEKTKSETKEEIEEVEPKNLENVALAEDVDDLLEEIDSVLEENAEEFIRGYVQKGGQ